MTASVSNDRCLMGVQGLDEILGGGLPNFSIYSVQGEPGTGKTTLASQFLLEGARAGERSLYITFSETKRELDRVAESHGWDLSKVQMMDLSAISESIDKASRTT